MKSISENTQLIKYIGKIENLIINSNENKFSDSLIIYPVENILLGFEDIKNIKKQEKS